MFTRIKRQVWLERNFKSIAVVVSRASFRRRRNALPQDSLKLGPRVIPLRAPLSPGPLRKVQGYSALALEFLLRTRKTCFSTRLFLPSISLFSCSTKDTTNSRTRTFSVYFSPFFHPLSARSLD